MLVTTIFLKGEGQTAKLFRKLSHQGFMGTEVKRVYISSTYEDLKEVRQEARLVIGHMGWIACGMENAPATNEDSLTASLSDVQSCDVYVCIIGFRYGSIPEGYSKSITRLEYEKASEKDIPRLIFRFTEKAKLHFARSFAK